MWGQNARLQRQPCSSWSIRAGTSASERTWFGPGSGKGFGFGQAAIRGAAFFRYRPPMNAAGRPIEGQRVTVFIQMGRQ